MTSELNELARMRVRVAPFGDMLLNAWDVAPHQEALIFPSRRKTYQEVVDAVMNKARGLMALGIKPGEHVGLLLPTGTDFVEMLFAVAMVGAVSVPMNARYKADEIAYMAENADLVAIVTNSESDDIVEFAARIQEAFPGTSDGAAGEDHHISIAPKLRKLVLLGGKVVPGFVDQSAFDAAAEVIDEALVHQARLAVRLRDTCMLLYTSGTSARPKGCVLSHEAVCRVSVSVARDRWAFRAHERVWSPMPLFHIAAISSLLAAVEVAGVYIGQPHFDPGESLRQIEAERATMLFLPFVTFHQAMIAHPNWSQTDMSSVRLMNGCFCQMPDSVTSAYRAKMPNSRHVGTFGMSETSGIVTTGGISMPEELGLTGLGYPLEGISVRVVDCATGADAKTGGRGEIWIRGYGNLDGYYRDPAKTSEAIDADGWYHSGDIGSLDALGHLHYHGRLKDMLKVGGENVAAAEVEAVLNNHPAIELSQVAGIPDERLAEVPVAWVKLRNGASATEEELIAYMRARLASFKVPRHIRFVMDWPMSSSKIMKVQLRKDLLAELGLPCEGAPNVTC